MTYHHGMKVVCGIDEAGRGPLAGPVTAAAVVLTNNFDRTILADSKKLNDQKRRRAFALITEHARDWNVGWAWPEEIDRINIHNASLLAMKRAFSGIAVPVDLVLADGKFIPMVEVACRAVVKGDSLIHEIMAASILAKVARDRWMERYAWIEPDYGFDKHKGYPTKEHREKCLAIGLSPIHRRSFTVRPTA